MQNDSSPDNWCEWLEANSSRFLLFARQQTRTETDAEDVLQDSLVESWRRAGNRRPKPALVFTTIRRRAIDLGRSHERRLARELVSESEKTWFEPDIETRDSNRVLESAVRTLPPDQAEVLVLKTWGELTFREIAETLGIPQNTAASRYRYALEELRKCLKGALL